MLRMFKVTSPMSVGTWIVTFSGLASGLATSLEIIGRLPRAKLVAEAAAGALGPFLSTYTAALLADTAVPAWHEARRELPFVFAGSSAASAGAACALIAPPRAARPARRLAIAGAALELAAAAVMERRLGFLAEPYKRGRAGALATAAKALTAAGALTMLVRGRHRGGAIGAGALLLGGLAGRALRHLPRGPRLRRRPSIHHRPPATARGPARGDARLMPLTPALRATRESIAATWTSRMLAKEWNEKIAPAKRSHGRARAEATAGPFTDATAREKVRKPSTPEAPTIPSTWPTATPLTRTGSDRHRFFNCRGDGIIGLPCATTAALAGLRVAGGTVVLGRQPLSASRLRAAR